MRLKTALLRSGFALITFAALCHQASGQVPDTISVQFAVDSAGTPVNANKNVLVQLYRSDLVVKSFPLGVVPIVDGILNVELPVDEVDFSRPLELGLTIGSDPEMTPRTPVRSAPYALGLRALRVRPDTDPSAGSVPTLIGGAESNSVHPAAYGATIGGGGNTMFSFNRVYDHYGTIGGGTGNTAGMVAGIDPTAEAFAVVGGGNGNSASGYASTVAGGVQGTASGELSFIGGGNLNQASGEASVIGGGVGNDATANNTTVSGGSVNEASDYAAAVSGGVNNVASGQASTVGGGDENVAGGNRATVGGGTSNEATGNWSTVAGGRSNAARGNNSYAAGLGAKADHTSSFIWNDAAVEADSFATSGTNQFLVRARGGFQYWHEDSLVFVADERGIMPGVDGVYNLGSTALRWDSLWSYYPPIIISDAREKSEVDDIRDGLQRAMALRPVSYRLNRNPAARQLGLIAQEAIEAVPEAVVANPAGYGVQYSALVPVLISAIQEQQRLIEQQSARIERLELRLND